MSLVVRERKRGQLVQQVVVLRPADNVRQPGKKASFPPSPSWQSDGAGDFCEAQLYYWSLSCQTGPPTSGVPAALASALQEATAGMASARGLFLGLWSPCPLRAYFVRKRGGRLVSRGPAGSGGSRRSECSAQGDARLREACRPLRTALELRRLAADGSRTAQLYF